MEAIEQRLCMQFYFKLEKNSSKAFELFQQAFEDNFRSRTTFFFSDINGLRKVEHPLSITNDLVDPRLVKHMKLLLVFVKLFKIDVFLSIREVAENVGISYGSFQ